jgi:hypothetical protein
MRPPTLDLTAGRRAREISTHPGTSQTIPDPTDPRCGLPAEALEGTGEMHRLDPTDPSCGRLLKSA